MRFEIRISAREHKTAYLNLFISLPPPPSFLQRIYCGRERNVRPHRGLEFRPLSSLWAAAIRSRYGLRVKPAMRTGSSLQRSLASFGHSCIPPCHCKKDPKKGVPELSFRNQGSPADPAAFTRHLTGSAMGFLRGKGTIFLM